MSYQIKETHNGTVCYSGLFIDIINVMAEFMNFKYVFFSIVFSLEDTSFEVM